MEPMEPSPSGSRDSPSPSRSGSRSGSLPQMAFCHECGIEIRPLMTPDPTCPRCNGQFVEIIEENSSSHPHAFLLEPDDQDDADPFGALHRDPSFGYGFRAAPTRTAGGNAAPPLTFIQGPGAPLPQGLGGLLAALASGVAQQPPTDSNRHPQSTSSPDSHSPPEHTSGPGSNAESTRSPDQTQRTARSGTTSFGPFGLHWNVQYGSGGGDPYQRAAQHQAEHDPRSQQQDVRQPPTLSNFLRFAFGPESTHEFATARPGDDVDHHDDGMGGAGGASDGRRFHHNHPRSSDDATARETGRTADLPPELSALRNLFTGLFGEPGANGGSLLDILASGAHGGGAGGPRGQWGDYVLGQQGLDDIISQLMEQTQGSNAPPPASEDVIDKLERFTLNDKERIEKAKNQDCPTCKDEFLASPTESKADQEGESKGEADDEKQQEELISMPCAHIFHVDCLVPWLRLHGTCPVCRVSIAKPREESSNANNHSNSSGNDGQNDSGSSSGPVPGGWPSPPTAFTSLFGARPNEGVRSPHESDTRGAETTTYHPQPPTSTTVTSTVYASPPSLGRGEVVNSIVSSPPIVSDRAAFFDPPEQEATAMPSNRQDMRETLRRAAEARAARNDADQPPSRAQLEPDELD